MFWNYFLTEERFPEWLFLCIVCCSFCCFFNNYLYVFVIALTNVYIKDFHVDYFI